MGVLTNVPQLPVNITQPIEFFDYTVEVMPLFWPVMLIVIAVIIFSRTSIYGLGRALIVSGLIPGIVGIIVAVLGWMDPKWMYLFGIILAAGLFLRNLESGS